MSDDNILEKAFGIDLGTTYSAIAHFNTNTQKPEICMNSADNSSTTPSVVFVESKENHVVGKAAKQQSHLEPERVVDFVKRLIGKFDLAREIDGHPYRPEEISASILKQLKADAESDTGCPVKKVVITCPAYFGMKERMATKIAGELAEMEVLQIIEEPIAAALSYDVKPGENKTILVYDLGGGTFDVTLIKFEADKPPQVLCADGADTLGGKDWDDRLLEFLMNEFQRQCPEAPSISDDLHAMQELRTKAEETKIALTKSESRKVPVRFDGNQCNIEVTREKFDEITADLLSNSITPLDRLLNEAAPLVKGYTDFDELLLVGGSTFMPQVKRMLEEKFPGKPIRSHKPNEAVAMGAAILANNIALFEWASKTMGIEPKHEDDEDDNSKPAPTPTPEQLEKLEKKAKEQGLDIQVIKGLGKTNTQAAIPVSPKSYGVLAFSPTSKIRSFYESKDCGDSFESENPRTNATHTGRVSNIIWKNDRIWDDQNKTIRLEKTKTFGTSEDNQETLDIEIFENEELPSEENMEYSVSETFGERISNEDDPIQIMLPPNVPAGTPVTIIFSLDQEGILKVKGECVGRIVKAEIKVSNAMSREEVEKLKISTSKVIVSN